MGGCTMAKLAVLAVRQEGLRMGRWLGDDGGERRRIGGAVDAPLSIVAVAAFGSGLSVAKTALGTCIVVVTGVALDRRFLAASSFSSGLEGGVI